MSSFLCFICHNTVNSDTNEDIREKYRDIVGMNLCPDSHLCYICLHMIDKLWTFKSVCLKRSLEYPVLFSEKGTINLHHSDIETTMICTEDSCNISTNKTQIFVDNRDQSIHSNDYYKLEDEHDNFDDYFTETVDESGQKNDMNDQDERIDNFEGVNREFDGINREFDGINKEFDGVNKEFVGNNKEFDGINRQFDENHKINHDNEITNVNNDSSKENEDEMKVENNFDGDYDDEKNECLNEIRNEGETEEAEQTEKKSKPKKTKKKDFEKIILTLEEQKAELEAQRKSKKYLEAEFKCYSCALGFLFKDTYQAHMMRHEESNGEYICFLCSLRFATSALLRSHSQLHTLRYRCTRCDRRIRQRQCHSHSKHCHNKLSDVTCHLCATMFQDASGLQQHLKRFHMTKTSNRTYPCSVCGKNYNNQAAVRTHMIKHIHRKFTCDTCPATFSSPYTLTQHKKKHKPPENEEQHYCDTCGISYSSRKSLLAHKRSSINHQERAYECPICRRMCPNEKALTSHISTVHSTNKSYCCSTCNARYTSRKSLVRHIRSHTVVEQPKMAVCHLCGNSFKSKSKLNRHLIEVCEKEKLEEELASYYEHHAMH